MKPDFFKNLPLEIIAEIFLRLPVVSIPISKCVCKRWLHLLESDAFVKSHFARSAPALVFVGDSNQLKVLELEGYNPLTKYDFPYRFIGRIRNCFNGFLVVRVGFNKLCVCNPITREVLELDLPTDPQQSTLEVSALGFGASEVVCIKRRPYDDKLDCHVYTLGTGSWRRLEGIPFNYHSGSGAFVNGNLHWLATIGEDSSWISCFDLETECFSFFKAPPYHAQELPFIRGTTISAMSGCLWFCKVASEYESYGGRCELTVWIMKEYGVDESWSMEYVIPIDDGSTYVDPIKVFENGDLLMLVTVYFSERLFYYSNKTKTMQSIDLFGAGETSDRVKCGLFTPTFVSLKTL
ncbi:putative F-box protein At3g51171 [Salvia miltiorrhiza]|uniref:putative F-box protein At3g51171 n=1 Tax=Salvia miltiorrhiza TaxID=226208 RepID=UPI0025AD755F|nr:putative F-box protein At3g51171 [Salvia miltiorrhiza]